MQETAISIGTIKNISYVLAFVATVEFLGFNAQSLSILIALMTLDVVTGIIRACSQEGCQSIKSAIGVRGVLAKLLLLTALFSIGIAGIALGYEMHPVIQGAVNILVLAELYSVLGNIHSARTGKKKNEFDAVAFLLNRVKELLHKYLK